MCAVGNNGDANARMLEDACLTPALSLGTRAPPPPLRLAPRTLHRPSTRRQHPRGRQDGGQPLQAHLSGHQRNAQVQLGAARRQGAWRGGLAAAWGVGTGLPAPACLPACRARKRAAVLGHACHKLTAPRRFVNAQEATAGWKGRAAALADVLRLHLTYSTDIPKQVATLASTKLLMVRGGDNPCPEAWGRGRAGGRVVTCWPGCGGMCAGECADAWGSMLQRVFCVAGMAIASAPAALRARRESLLLCFNNPRVLLLWRPALLLVAYRSPPRPGAPPTCARWRACPRSAAPPCTSGTASAGSSCRCGCGCSGHAGLAPGGLLCAASATAPAICGSVSTHTTTTALAHTHTQDAAAAALGHHAQLSRTLRAPCTRALPLPHAPAPQAVWDGVVKAAATAAGDRTRMADADAVDTIAEGCASCARAFAALVQVVKNQEHRTAVSCRLLRACKVEWSGLSGSGRSTAGAA